METQPIPHLELRYRILTTFDAMELIERQMLQQGEFFDEPLPHLAARHIAYDLEADSNTRALLQLLEGTHDPRDDAIKEAFVDDPKIEMIMRESLQRALGGDYSGVRSCFDGFKSEVIDGEFHDLTDLAESIPLHFEPFRLPIPAWNDPYILDLIRENKQGGE